MPFPMRHFLPRAAVAGLALAATAAQAHTGHAVHGLFEGLVHPLALDHLLMAAAVGLWSAFGLRARQAWAGPAAFMGGLLVASVAASGGWAVAGLEHGIALTVALAGALVAFAQRAVAPVHGTLGFLALAGALHGAAHGAQAPANSFALYAAGLVVTTLALHALGAFAGLRLRAGAALVARRVLGATGAFMGGAGLLMLLQA